MDSARSQGECQAEDWFLFNFCKRFVFIFSCFFYFFKRILIFSITCRLCFKGLRCLYPWIEVGLRKEHHHHHHHSSPTCTERRRRWTRLGSLRWRHDDVIIPGVIVVMATLLLQRCGQCWNGVIHHVKTRINDKLDETWKRIRELRFTSRQHTQWLSSFCPFSSAHDTVNVRPMANSCRENNQVVATLHSGHSFRGVAYSVFYE